MISYAFIFNVINVLNSSYLSATSAEKLADEQLMDKLMNVPSSNKNQLYSKEKCVTAE